jgi:uncharacterized ion transporter superfamily protein YfcC
VKRNLIKAVAICFIIFAILTWIIPVGTYSSGELSTSSIDPISFFDLVAVPITTIITFIMFGVVFAVIGGLYGVMDKTGALAKFVSKVRSWFKGKEKLFLVLTILHFVILSSFTGLLLPLFALVPLYAAIMFEMGYKKLTTLVATVGAMLVGSIGSTYGFNISGYTKNIFSLDMNDQIVGKIILLVLITIALIVFVIKTAKREEVKPEPKQVAKKEEVKKAPVKKAAAKTTSKKTTTTTKKATTTTKKTTAKKAGAKKKTTAALATESKTKKVKVGKRVSIVPLVVILTFTLIAAMVGMYNWYYSFGVDTFNNIYDSVIGVEIKDFPIFEYLLSGISQMGYWGNAEFASLLIIAAALIAWIYRLSLNEFVESFIKGVKEWMPTALYATIASIILCVLYQGAYSGSGTLATTVIAKIFAMSDGFNVILTGIASLIGSFFYNDLYYLLSEIFVFTSGFDTNALQIAGLVSQAMYGLGMLLLPTSVVLIAGLSHFDVSYKQWIKYIWKFALIVFVIILVICCILSAL